MPPKIVLVTGVSRFLGGHLASRLAADPDIDRVIGVDTEPPPRDLRRRMGRAEFVRADIRNPLIAKVISGAEVDTVVHASLSPNPIRSGGRVPMMEMNVIGTMQLLAACQRSGSVRKLVVKSTTAVYGASGRDPAMFTEDMTPKSLPSGGYAKDAVEIEGYVRGFARRRTDVTVTQLRFTNFIGPRMDTVMTRYFSLPVTPTVLGYDARVQLLHEDDALAVLTRATTGTFVGTVNVGGEGTLTGEGVVGTPQYMAPEQASGGTVTHLADVYALGAIAYRCLTGRSPFKGKDLAELVYQVVHAAPMRPGVLGKVSRSVEDVLAVARAKDPRRRFPSAISFAQAFVAARRGKPIVLDVPNDPWT